MKTNELINLLNDPTTFEINKLKPRASKINRSLQNEILEENLDGVWDFEFFENINLRDENFMNKQKFSNKINVPMHIELSGYGQIQYVNTQYPWDGVEQVEVGKSPIEINTCGQYTKFIQIAEIHNFEDYIISFEGVESAFNLWINGQHVGYSTDTFTTCEFNIKQYLKNGINQISVEVYKFSSSSWLEDQDFWRFSGIFRSVILKKITKEHIMDFSIKYDVEQTNVKGTITLDKAQDFAVEVKLIDQNNNIIFETKTANKNIEFNLQNIKLWNAEIPTLYKFIFKTNFEIFEKKIGFRKILIEDKIIKVNDKRIIFKGMNRHEFDPFKGRAIGYNEIKKDLLLLKEHNFNAIRCSHYPNNTLFYELCDEIGFYVIDEVNLETHGTWMLEGKPAPQDKEVVPDNNKQYKENVLKRAINLYERDKNNTSVIIWSLGNESFGGETLFEMSEYFRKVDKHRLVHYEGIFFDRRFPKTSDIESQMYTSSEKVEKYFAQDYEKPFILCEYTHAMGNSNGNLKDYIRLEEKYPSYQGGFIWEYMDQAINQDGKYLYGGDFEDRPTDYNFICDGLVGPNREITDKLKYVSNLFSEIRVEEEEEKFILKNTNVFKDLNNLILNIYTQSENTSKLLKSKIISIEALKEVEILKDNNRGVIVYELIDNNKLIKEFSDVNYEVENNTATYDTRFVDGDCNFGLHAKEFSVLFSKTHNNIISIKYDNKELIESIENTIKPNFWRAPTNNDIGANIDKEFSIWKHITNFQSSKILNYKYENEQLYVNIEYTVDLKQDYKVIIEYTVQQSGNIIIKTKYNKMNNMPSMYNFGLNVSLDSRYKKFKYLGCADLETYCDRNDEVVKKYSDIIIADQKPYLYPQEFANRTKVNIVKILDDSNKGFAIESKEDFEFSLTNYSDVQLENTRNKHDLHKEKPYLRINHKQSGVAGDDSWGSWCKDKYIVKADEDMEFTIIIKKI